MTTDRRIPYTPDLVPTDTQRAVLAALLQTIIERAIRRAGEGY